MQTRKATDLIRELLPPKGLRVLDIGCGDGALTRFLAREGAVATGIDISAARLAEARVKEVVPGADYREGRGEAVLEFVPEGEGAKGERLVFSDRFDCKKCGAKYQEPEPRLFSFNNPYGACPRCQGFGTKGKHWPKERSSRGRNHDCVKWRWTCGASRARRAFRWTCRIATCRRNIAKRFSKALPAKISLE